MPIVAAVGTPVVVTVKVPGTPVWKAAALALVIAGGWFTVSVKFCVAFGSVPLAAVIVIGKLPPAAGVPESTPAVLSVTPAGRAPVAEKVGAGKPVAVTVKLPRHRR
jgi:hypothetical protein